MKAMRVVEVVPVVKGIAKSSLSYFTKENPKPGSLVRIPLRGGSATGIILTSKEAKTAKTDLKKATFALKRLTSRVSTESIDEGIVEAVINTAEYYSATPGSVFSAILAKPLLERPDLIAKRNNSKINGKFEVRTIQLDHDERLREYRAIVRECFARSVSIMIVVPTKEDALRTKEVLKTGIEDYVYELPSLSDKELKKNIAKSKEEKHPILIITTPIYIALTRRDLETIILEKENSRAYRSQMRPFIHYRIFLEFYAKAKSLRLILGDSVLSTESLWKLKEEKYSELIPLTWRLKQTSHVEIIDMKLRKDFQILSDRLLSAIESTLSRGGKIYLFALRKGLSSTTVCGDCGSLLLCKNCSAPLVLHEGPIYSCHHCGAKRSPETRCDNCQSWKLLPLGIGVERVAEEIKTKLPHAEIFIIDKDHTSTSTKARSVMKKFEQSRHGILIGTEQAIFYLNKVSLVGVTSLDSLFSVPDFFINERIFYLITALRELAGEKFIFQTRNVGREVLEYAVAGNVLDFFRKEIQEREELRYPPFTIFIKVDTDGDINRWEKEFSPWQPHFIGDSMVIRIEKEDWPDRSLSEKLLLLPPSFLIKVDTESIF